MERNLEIAAQCCIDICHRIIALEQAVKPTDYYDAILRMGELGVLPLAFAHQLAPIAGFRNILIHEYLKVDWDIVRSYAVGSAAISGGRPAGCWRSQATT